MKKIAFICPLSKENSDIRKRSDEIMKGYIEPIADELGYQKPLRADYLSGNNIMSDIIDMLYQADVVIADLSDLNVNVFYELGLFHAIKGKFITIKQRKNMEEPIPFDTTYFRVQEYDYPNSGVVSMNVFKEKLKKRIIDLENKNYLSCFTFNPEDLSRLFNTTVVVRFVSSKKEHYSMARELFKKECKNIFLMQRSSSIILGAEQGWTEEGSFLQVIINEIKKCDNFYHIISLEGIEAHFKRKDSTFPNFKSFSKNLINIDGNVAIKKNNESSQEENYLIRRLPEYGEEGFDEFFKLDRQARVLIVVYKDDTAKAVIVQNLGSQQTCFLMEGDEIKKYFFICKDYYSSCKLVTWNEIITLYKKYEDEINVRTEFK
jgi:hypothetical protein